MAGSVLLRGHSRCQTPNRVGGSRVGEDAARGRPGPGSGGPDGGEPGEHRAPGIGDDGGPEPGALEARRVIGHVDEVRMDVAPVVLGSGKRFFGSVRGQHLLDDPDVVIQGTRVLHLNYRVKP